MAIAYLKAKYQPNADSLRYYTAFHNNVQNYAITELRHKRVYGCRKKRLNTATFF